MLLEQHFFLPSANFSQILCRNDSKKMRRKVLFSTIQLLYFFMSLSEKLTSSSNTISTKATLLEFCKRGRSTPVQTTTHLKVVSQLPLYIQKMSLFHCAKIATSPSFLSIFFQIIFIACSHLQAKQFRRSLYCQRGGGNMSEFGAEIVS